jgi:hypothetical protein
MLLNICVLLQVACARNLVVGFLQELSDLALILVSLKSLFQIWAPFDTWFYLVLVFDPVGFFVTLEPFPIYFFPNVLYFSFGLCIFHIDSFLPEKDLEFLGVCSEHFVLIILKKHKQMQTTNNYTLLTGDRFRLKYSYRHISITHTLYSYRRTVQRITDNDKCQF